MNLVQQGMTTRIQKTPDSSREAFPGCCPRLDLSNTSSCTNKLRKRCHESLRALARPTEGKSQAVTWPVPSEAASNLTDPPGNRYNPKGHHRAEVSKARLREEDSYCSILHSCSPRPMPTLVQIQEAWVNIKKQGDHFY